MEEKKGRVRKSKYNGTTMIDLSVGSEGQKLFKENPNCPDYIKALVAKTEANDNLRTRNARYLNKEV